ncbi:MAG TPA: hypothetical protein DCM28_07045 [Phycisphaerales bacterium]|nr:hypothetical protein [Phycisphaerales bacterium]HCD32218.1 hypothetical protein [Phycisphaerales bacterium]|tara:strand:+ start:1446 stop:2417 length:972 start_codon:yes stop_codon:yes gene_type:complete
MLSRVADSIYWMGRYIERAENIARFISVNHHLALDMPVEEEEQWEPLVTVTGDIELFKKRYGTPTKQNVIQFLAFDPQYPHSILSCLRAARENARSIRGGLSTEIWHHLNSIYLTVNQVAQQMLNQEVSYNFFDQVQRNSHLFSGLSDDTMSHGEGWQFLRLGRYIERADKTSRMLDVKYFVLLPSAEYVGTPYDNIQWSAVLKSISALEPYRQRYHRISPKQIVEFLVLDREFPRSIYYCLASAEDAIHQITGSMPGTFHSAAERQLGKLKSDLSYTDITDVMRVGIHEFLDEFQEHLNVVGQSIFETFFAVKPVQLETAVV